MNNIANISSIENLRDLSHIVNKRKIIKPGMLLRSANLANLNDEDSEILRSCNVRTIIDFRDYKERATIKDKTVPSATNIFLPVLDDMQMSLLSDDLLSKKVNETSKLIEIIMNQSERMKKFYRKFVTEETSIYAFKNFFEILINSENVNSGVLYHCTAGKDRTGYATFLILSALGIEKKLIIQDYLMSNLYMKHKIEQGARKFEKLGIEKKIINVAKKNFFADENYLNESCNLIDNEFGGINKYLEEVLELDKEKIDYLKKIFLI